MMLMIILVLIRMLKMMMLLLTLFKVVTIVYAYLLTNRLVHIVGQMQKNYICFFSQ